MSCDNWDITSYTTRPPPQFRISSSPNPLEIRPGEEKPAQLRIKSESSIDSVSLITTNITESGIQTNLTSDQISIRPFGNGTTTLRVEALDNATAKTPYPTNCLQACDSGEFPQGNHNQD
jgi:hypothetical protein